MEIALAFLGRQETRKRGVKKIRKKKYPAERKIYNIIMILIGHVEVLPKSLKKPVIFKMKSNSNRFR